MSGFSALELAAGQATHWYRGACPRTEIELGLPRTLLAENLARDLMKALPSLQLKEGKMFGVLLVRDQQGGLSHGKAFSGTLHGSAFREGWVPPFAQSVSTELERETLERLEQWKLTLSSLQAQIERHGYLVQQRKWSIRQAEIRELHRQAKSERLALRQSQAIPEDRDLDDESRRQSRQWREFRQAMEQELGPELSDYQALGSALQQGKAQRRDLSRALQAEMHQQFAHSLWAALGCQLERLFPQGPPTGTGDCCAPKLLAWASREELEPLALAEFWWGPTSLGGKQTGEFYPACRERCQPMMGALLALALRPRIGIVFADADLVVADKPSDLLTVPGRYHWNQDSLLGRLRQRWPELLSVHRLDLETSGLVVLARGPQAQAALQAQFAGRTVKKTYQALLSRLPATAEGCLELSLDRDPARSGCYRVASEGKSASTQFRLLDVSQARIELRPLTGRSHQLRLHMAQGLGIPIRGDRLYGHPGVRTERLMLHAAGLEFDHPSSGRRLHFAAEVPF